MEPADAEGAAAADRVRALPEFGKLGPLRMYSGWVSHLIMLQLVNEMGAPVVLQHAGVPLGGQRCLGACRRGIRRDAPGAMCYYMRAC